MRQWNHLVTAVVTAVAAYAIMNMGKIFGSSQQQKENEYNSSPAVVAERKAQAEKLKKEQDAIRKNLVDRQRMSLVGAVDRANPGQLAAGNVGWTEETMLG